MNRLSRSTLLILCLSGISTASANSGAIRFDAVVTMPTCSVWGSADASGSGESISLTLGDVPMNDLRSADTVVTHRKNLTLIVLCPSTTAYTKATATLNPRGGSGVDPDDSRQLKLTSTSVARSVAVALWEGTTLLNMGSDPKLTATMSPALGNNVAIFSLFANYARTTGVPVSGSANATLPFALTYE